MRIRRIPQNLHFSEKTAYPYPLENYQAYQHKREGWPDEYKEPDVDCLVGHPQSICQENQHINTPIKYRFCHLTCLLL